MPLKQFSLYFFILNLFFVTSCTEEAATIASPSEVAIQFFELIYNQHDLEPALAIASPQYARILGSYHSAERVQKVLFNLRYDEVVIKEDKTSNKTVIITDNTDKYAVTLMFDGRHNGNIIRDLRTVFMIKHNGEWVVDKLKADNFR